MNAIKRLIVALVVHRLIPADLAHWLIQNLGLLHA